MNIREYRLEAFGRRWIEKHIDGATVEIEPIDDEADTVLIRRFGSSKWRCEVELWYPVRGHRRYCTIKPTKHEALKYATRFLNNHERNRALVLHGK